MATTFPSKIQTFPTMQNIEVADADLIKQYQTAIQNGDFISAQQILSQISEVNTKIINADLLNTVSDTVKAIEQYIKEFQAQKIVVSSTRPESQNVGDFWWRVI